MNADEPRCWISLPGGNMRSLISAVSIMSALLSTGAVAQDRDGDWEKSQIQHVLLISIDGME
jgi:hypothetical protein